MTQLEKQIVPKESTMVCPCMKDLSPLVVNCPNVAYSEAGTHSDP